MPNMVKQFQVNNRGDESLTHRNFISLILIKGNLREISVLQFIKRRWMSFGLIK